MLKRIRRSSKTLTGRLALFFSLVSLVLGGTLYAAFVGALYWSEDRVGERQIMIDRNAAIERFNHGESGVLYIDSLTDAYNDLSLVPENYQEFVQEKDAFVGEIDTVGDDSRMVYIGEYSFRGEVKPIVLLSRIDEVELSNEEVLVVTAGVLIFVLLLLAAFSALLYRLSKGFIQPISTLSDQLTESAGNPTFEFSISEDAAVEYKQLTQQLNKYRHDIQVLLKREQAFARYASHELRTPLTVIKGSNKLLARGTHNDFAKRQLQRIEEASSQMADMVDALLSLVRYERSEHKLEFRSFEHAELTRIIEQNAAQADQKQIRIIENFSAAPSIQATPAIMNMLIGNLIRNAIAASPEGHITVNVSQDSVSVVDSGEGLTDEPNSEGHGLGLMIVDDFCQRYNWTFNISNNSDIGCTAQIHFGHHSNLEP
ncbi:sensor histidine kinase [Vibrio maerlii]|uniref:sensor histidine kinase n=1 Tax=Vibrio maerlii TaxID=2231648 RepID=UPI000E3E8967|nr:HAMP domain-containing sensor histidine kinase [Vibrio maerlii]